MTIKPIDMQTNIAQMHEVARNNQVRSEAVTEQQHVLDRESDEKSKQVSSKLDENKKLEQARIMREDKKRQKGKDRSRDGEKEAERREDAPPPYDGTMGRFIDIKK